MASLTDDNEAGGNLDKRNIWLIGVGHTSHSQHPAASNEASSLLRCRAVCDLRPASVGAGHAPLAHSTPRGNQPNGESFPQAVLSASRSGRQQSFMAPIPAKYHDADHR